MRGIVRQAFVSGCLYTQAGQADACFGVRRPRGSALGERPARQYRQGQVYAGLL